MKFPSWQRCIEVLETRIAPQPFATWIRPLTASVSDDGIRLYAPNTYVRDHVESNYLGLIRDALRADADGPEPVVLLLVGEANAPPPVINSVAGHVPAASWLPSASLMREFDFESFVPGRSNQIALAAAEQVANEPGTTYNPLFIYGGVGLGKTHLMQAIGNRIREREPDARVLYQSSEGFVSNMINALRRADMETFKRHYRSVDALLIDDVQFFAGKDRTQEEFFHTFNALLEDRQQVVVTCDRFAKEVEGLEERLQSRFNWGLPVAIEPPELETRTAILMRKAEADEVRLPQDIAMFIAQHIRSNVRELEGVLRRVVAHAKFVNAEISLEITREAIRDVLVVHSRQTTVDNIQRTVANFYKIRVADIVSTRRTRTIVRPRQIAMALAKALTSHSYPELGELFGGRDHTTVIHACRKVEELRANDPNIRDEYDQLLRMLGG